MPTEIMTIITSGFTTVQESITDVITIAVPALVGVIALSAGVTFAVRKIRSVFYHAS